MRRFLRRQCLSLVTAVAVVSMGWSVLSSRPVAAYGSASVSLSGHGWGHGIGLGQWGALGYSLEGQSYSWILSHYYGTSSSSVLNGNVIRVRIVANDGNDIIVTSASPFTLAGISMSAGTAGRLHLSSPGSWAVSTGPGCAGPWTPAGTASDSQAFSNGFDGQSGAQAPTTTTTTTTGGSAPAAEAVPSVTDPTASRDQVLQLCQGSGNLYLRGSIEAAEIQGVARTVNILPLDEYLSGVVPSESPAYWGTLGSSGAQGQPQGFQSLEAQAVAARSYAIAAEEASSSQGGTGQYGYADICDTTSCQVYGGIAAENATSNQAVADTAGQILVGSSGAAINAEFSSSTGGWTAGGSFPSVVDAGDAVCTPSACNPNHNWTASIPVSSIQAAYPSIGTLESVAVTQRSGPAQADQGGRAASLSLQGSSGSVTITGSTFASQFGLKSNWFSVVGVPSGGVDGYWIGASDGGIFSFGAASFHGSTGAMKLNQPVVGMASTPDGGGYWLVARDGGIFTFGDAGFFGSMGGVRLNQPVVGMAATADGRGYWLVASDGGIFTFGDAHFEGSAGNLKLNQPVVGLAPTRDGGGYWTVARDGGIFNYGDARFFGSTGGTTLATPITSVAPSPSGGGYWLLEAGGAVHPFGDAGAFGSASPPSGDAAVGLAPTATGKGYLVVTRHGTVYSFGDAPNFGGVSSQVPSYSGSALALAPRYGS